MLLNISKYYCPHCGQFRRLWQVRKIYTRWTNDAEPLIDFGVETISLPTEVVGYTKICKSCHHRVMYVRNIIEDSLLERLRDKSETFPSKHSQLDYLKTKRIFI